MNRSDAQERTLDVHQAGANPRGEIKKLGSFIRDIHTAMLTTVTASGHLRSRPMVTQQSDVEDELWFYIDTRSALVDDITGNHQVGLTYVDGSKRYVSVSGIAHIVESADLLKKYWHARIAEWFPDGPENDPHLALLRVQLEEAEYWDVSSRAMVKLLGFARSGEREVPRPTRRPGGIDVQG